MNARTTLTFSEAEAAALLRTQKTIILASAGPDGFPHLAPMWFLPLPDGRIGMWTNARSQKVRNLRREPRATLLAEAGVRFTELRGLSLDCSAEVVDDPRETIRLGTELTARYRESFTDPDGAALVDLDAVVHTQARHRVGLLFTPLRTRSWDHRKAAAPLRPGP